MAALNHCKDLNDVALKPRLLLSLLKDKIPDETHPFRDPSELSSIVSTLKIHKLLFEDFPSSADDKLVRVWESAVDSWTDRILALSRSNLPDKCWAGVCLLGVTSTECSSSRFLAKYADWFNVLLSHIQPSGGSQFVKVASCAAISDLLIRLGGFSNLKKDGNSHVGKLVQPVLKMLNEDATETVSDVAAHLLLTILNHFPFSVHRHLDNAEGVIVSKIMSANCSSIGLKKLSCCLASLPKSKGDEDSWCLMMQKILLSLSALLNNTLEGLEEETRREEAVMLLVPPGRDAPPSLGGKMMTAKSLNTGERSQKSRISSISSLMQSCCMMLTNSYPVQVAVPVYPLLALIRRVLMVNGAVPETLKPLTTAMQQEFVCLQLPVLHLNMLEVLAGVVKVLCSQILPHAAEIVNLVVRYFETCHLSELRTKAYSIIRALLISMGAGMTLYIAQEVVDNVSTDLILVDSNFDGAPLDEQSSERRHKKRNHGAATVLSVEQQAPLCLEARESQSSIALKIAAIETLEALLMMGGALRCDSWRRNIGALKCDNWRKAIDKLMIKVATNAFIEGATNMSKETKIAWEDFQLVALRALLASLLSPAGYRPPYLSKGLELFRKGKQNSGTKVAEFSAQALVALEVLVHPRALPLIDTALSNSNSYSVGKSNFGDPINMVPQKDGILRTVEGSSHDVMDFLRDEYIQENSSSEVPASRVCDGVQFDEKTHDVFRDHIFDETNVVNSLPDKMMPQGRDEGLNLANFGNKIDSTDGSSVMMDVELHEKSNETAVAPVSCDDDTVMLPLSSPMSDAKGFENNTSNAVASDVLRTNLLGVSTQGIVSSSTTGLETTVTSHADKRAWKISAVEHDDESDDSFPDIIDADPDSDSE